MNVRTPQCEIRLYVLIWRDSHVITLFISNRLHVCVLLSHFWETALSMYTSCILRKTPKAQLYPHCQGSPSHSIPVPLSSHQVWLQIPWTFLERLSRECEEDSWPTLLSFFFLFLAEKEEDQVGINLIWRGWSPVCSPWVTWTLPFVVNTISFIDAAPVALRFNCWLTVCRIANQTEVFLLLILSLKLLFHFVQHHPHFMWSARLESNLRVFGLLTPGIEVLLA